MWILRSLLIFILMPTLALADIIPNDEEIDWSNVGISGGIPSDYAGTVNVMDYGCAADDSTDDKGCIQAAINAADADSQIVYIPAGDYRIASGLSINQDGIVLRGAGADNTVLRYTGTGTIISFSGGGGGTNPVAIDGGLSKGDTDLNMSSASGFSVGDLVWIDQQNADPPVSDTWGDGGNYCRGPRWISGIRTSSTDRNILQLAKVQSINGDIITLDAPLHMDYDDGNNPELAEVSQNFTSDSGVENLKIVRDNSSSGDNISMNFTVNSWVHGVWSVNAGQSHIQLGGLGNIISNTFIDGAHNVGSGNGYGMFLWEGGTDNLFINNIAKDLRHSFITECEGTGNVFAYNYSRGGQDGNNFLMADFSHHGIHGDMNLWEGNLGAHWSPDATHGSHSHNTALRNWFLGDTEGYSTPTGRRVIEIMADNIYHHVVGNVLGTSDTSYTAYSSPDTRSNSAEYIMSNGYTSDGDTTRNDSESESTAIFHGNYDFADDEVKWDGGIADHNLPNSYYVASAPSFFSDNGYTWPWVTPDEGTIYYKLPAKERYDAYVISDDPYDLFNEVSQGPEEGGSATVLGGGVFGGGSY